jgi:replicative DNA helicase
MLTNLNIQHKNRKTPLVNPMMVYGKVPPQAMELEGAIIGACMLERDAYPNAAEILKPEYFYIDAHQRIFKAFFRMAAKNQHIDMLTVVEELKKTEELDMVGGAYCVTKFTNSVVSTAHIQDHCRIVLQRWKSREIIRISAEAMAEAYEDSTDVFDLEERISEQFTALAMGSAGESIRHFTQYIQESLKNLESKRKNDTGITGIPSGIPALDKETCGWQPTDLIIIASAPAVGKSAFVKIVAVNAAKHFVGQFSGLGAASRKEAKVESVLLFTMEMSGLQVVNRVLSAESNVWMHRFKSARLDDAQMESLYLAEKKVRDLPIFIDETPGISIDALRSRCRVAKRKHNIGLVIVDYMQLASFNDSKNNREQEISKISRTLKGIAKELKVPVIALSQFSREGEKAGEPQMYHLRESGAIGQDADMVLLLWGHTSDEIRMDADKENIRYAKIAKARDGSQAFFAYVFDGNTQTINDFMATNRDGSPKFEYAPSPGDGRQVPDGYRPYKED